jgi:hypothetical protein
MGGAAMQTNGATNSDATGLAIGDMAPRRNEPMTARGRLEDRFRQAFAERARQVEKIEQHELGPATTADWRKQ